MKKVIIGAVLVGGIAGIGYYVYKNHKPNPDVTLYDKFNGIQIDPSVSGYVPSSTNSSCQNACSSDSKCTGFTISPLNTGYCKLYTATPADIANGASVSQTFNTMLKQAKGAHTTSWSDWSDCPPCIPIGQDSVVATRKCMGTGTCLGPSSQPCSTSTTPRCAAYQEDANTFPYYFDVDPAMPIPPSNVTSIGPSNLYSLIAADSLQACENTCSTMPDKCSGVWFDPNHAGFSDKMPDRNCALLAKSPDAYGDGYIPHEITSYKNGNGTVLAFRKSVNGATWGPWNGDITCQDYVNLDGTSKTFERTCNTALSGADSKCAGASKSIKTPDLYYEVDELVDTLPPSDDKSATYMSTVNTYFGPNLLAPLYDSKVSEGDCSYMASYLSNGHALSSQIQDCGGYTWDPTNSSAPCKLYSKPDVQAYSSPTPYGTTNKSPLLKVTRCKDAIPNAWGPWVDLCSVAHMRDRIWGTGDLNLGEQRQNC